LNGHSDAPSISDDGRYVAFETEANNAVSGDLNSGPDVLVKDMDTDTVVRASFDQEGDELDLGRRPSISDDGAVVAFWGQPAGSTDRFAYVRNLTGETTVEVGAFDLPSGEQPGVVLSGDASVVIFNTVDGSTSQLVVKVLASSTTEVVETGASEGDQFAVSDNGNHIAYADGQVHLWNRTTEERRLLSIRTDGSTYDWAVWYPSISGDGEYVTFYTYDETISEDEIRFHILRGPLSEPDPVTTTTTEPTVDPAACQWEWGGLQEPDPRPCPNGGEEIALSATRNELAEGAVLLLPCSPSRWPSSSDNPQCGPDGSGSRTDRRQSGQWVRGCRWWWVGRALVWGMR
jgi:hypothetical protein